MNRSAGKRAPAEAKPAAVAAAKIDVHIAPTGPEHLRHSRPVGGIDSIQHLFDAGFGQICAQQFPAPHIEAKPAIGIMPDTQLRRLGRLRKLNKLCCFCRVHGLAPAHYIKPSYPAKS